MATSQDIQNIMLGTSQVVALYAGHTPVWTANISRFTATNGAWSNPLNWSPQQVPATGATVVIPANAMVTLDVSTAVLAQLTIEADATLTFLDGHNQPELVLSSAAIMLMGTLRAGSATQPYASRAAIELVGPAQAEGDTTTLPGIIGHKALTLMDGTLALYGTLQGQPWSRLSQTAAAGATTITVDSTTGWAVGERIVVTATDFYEADSSGQDKQVEERTITAISGNTITLDTALTYQHYGVAETYADAAGQPRILQSRAEVIRLNRNFSIRSEAATNDTSSDRYRYGGQVMAMGQSTIRLDAIELTRLGQHGILLRYPIHFHIMQANGNGSPEPQ